MRSRISYFPHLIESGKTMFVLEQKFGNDGYAFWFKLLEHLARSDGHYIDCSDENSLNYFLAQINFKEPLALKILNLLVSLEALDKELWEQHKVIWSDNFVNNLAPLYARSKDKPTKPELDSSGILRNPQESSEILTNPQESSDEVRNPGKSSSFESKTVKNSEEFLEIWNEFATKHSQIPKINSLTEQRKDKLRKRKSEGFDLQEIIKAIEAQPFLLGKNDKKWAVSFDWLIINDTNFIKVLERRYSKASDARVESPEISESDPIYTLKEPTFHIRNPEKSSEILTIPQES